MEGETELTFNDYVRLSLESGVRPLELKFTPIVECSEKTPFAFRTETDIHSIIMGELKEDAYISVSDVRECGIELLKHNIQHVATAYKCFKNENKNVAFLTVRCPSELVEKVDLYELMTDVLKNNPSLNPQKLCLEFPASLLEKNNDKIYTAIKDMKLLKVKTAIVGCGSDDFPIAKLATMTPDYVMLDPQATAWAGNRNKPQLLYSMIAYIKSMGIETIAEGYQENYPYCRKLECFGFIFKDNDKLTQKEAIEQIVKEEV